jgi:triphosphoribosyl-dephospho-CoA synthase
MTLWEEAIQFACLSELVALKPGNVNRYSDHEDATILDFILSSVRLIKPLRTWFQTLTENGDGLGLGTAILNATRYQREKGMNQNINLGIILILYPLVTAITLLTKQIPIEALINSPDFNKLLRKKIISVLDVNCSTETFQVVKAINMANPSGLGRTDQYDVRNQNIEQEILSAGTTLRELFSISSDRDLICKEYETGFTLILEKILPLLVSQSEKYGGIIAGIEVTFLTLLSQILDTHVIRRHGLEIAIKVQKRATRLLKKTHARLEVELELKAFDDELKRQKINPGTIADLMVGGLFLLFIIKDTKN